MATAAETLPRSKDRSLVQRISGAFSRGPLHFLLILVGLFWILPTLGLLITSFRPAAQTREAGWWTVLTKPAQLTVENYQSILSNDSLITALINTFKIAVPSTIGVVVVASLAAYALAWIDFKGRDFVFIMLIAFLVVPLQMALIPAARLFGMIGIFDTIWAVIVFHVAFGLPFAIFLLRNFFTGIPQDLLEAARIDGASERQIFTRIVLPLGRPAIAALAIFQFLWTWNDLLVALTFASGPAAPLTVVVRQQMRQFGANLDVIAPGAFILMIVPLLVFFAFQRYFVQGLLAGSIK